MKLFNKFPIILSIYFANNNILCTITNLQGNTLTQSTAGINKIKGTKKVTISSIYALIKTLCSSPEFNNSLSVYIKIKGTSKIKTNFIKYLKLFDFKILLIQEKLCLPYGGCKKVKTRKL